METILQELSSMFDITIEAAQDFYPVIRQQLVIYNMTKTAIITATILAVVFVLSSFLGTLMYLDDQDYWDDDVVKNVRRALIAGCTLSILSGISIILFYTIRNIYAADLLLLKITLG